MIKKRESFIDILRGIGILLVIIGHCKCPGLILKLIQSFHMPLFFIISGYLFTIKEESYVSYIKRIFKRYIVPYGILGAINYFLYLFYLYITNSNINLRALAHRYLKGLVYSRGTWYWMPNCSPIWFLTAIFIACILFKILLNQKKYVQYILVILSIFITFITCEIGLFKLPWNIDSAIWGQSFMFFGYKLKEKDAIKTVSANKLLGILVALLSIVIGTFAALKNEGDYISMDNMICGDIILSFISSLSISFALFVIVYMFIKKSKVLEMFGRNTISVLGFNYVANIIVYDFWDRFFGTNDIYLFWVWQCIAQILLLAIIALIYQRLKKPKIEYC